MLFKHLFTPASNSWAGNSKPDLFHGAPNDPGGEREHPVRKWLHTTKPERVAGAGLIIMESSRPLQADDVSASYYIDSSTDDCIPGYKLVADKVHKHGCKVFAQINHGGRISHIPQWYAHGTQCTFIGSGSPLSLYMPRVMSTDYIQELVQAFAQAARRMAEAGLDGVELVASHGMLMAQFLNPLTNSS